MGTQGFELTADVLSNGFRDGSLSPVEVMQSVLDRADAVNPSINALIFVEPEEALLEAQASEARWRAGQPLSNLDGIPVSVKDSIAESRRPMLRGIKANWSNPPIGYDAPPSARLKEAGAIIWAKTTMPDFGLLASGVSSAFGVTRNPWDVARNTGGSTSGGAAAVAARLGPLSIGTDMGGSIRIPAAMCGLVGYKSTQGRVPHLPPSGYRSAGPVARTVKDAALLLNTLSRPDPRDYGSLPYDDRDFTTGLDRDLKGVRIGLLLEGCDNSLPEPAIRDALMRGAAALEQAGAIVEPIGNFLDSDFMPTLLRTFMVHGAVEYSGLPEATKSEVLPLFPAWYAGADEISALDLALANERIAKYKAATIQVLSRFDYIMSPTTSIVTVEADYNVPTFDDYRTMVYTTIWSQATCPSVTICGGFDPANGMPIGIMFSGNRFDDAGLLSLAATFEKLRGFDIEWPA